MPKLDHSLRHKISQHQARVAVIGLGYVGLPLAAALIKSGFPTIGIDHNQWKIDSLKAGKSYIPDVPNSHIQPHIKSHLFSVTTKYQVLKQADVIFICVPTPYDAQRIPDLTCVRNATQNILPYLHAEQLVVLQSTTYPGTTREIVLPILEKSGLQAGKDFYLAFSPERIDPGNSHWNAYNTPKVVGGLTPVCTQLTVSLFKTMGAPVYAVSTPDAAEMAKILENTFRSVNIALVNELALLAERMGINFWEVINAAKTKPFGFMPFYPGPGVGGHCIPIDPYYLSWKAREFDFHTQFIDLAGEVNQSMSHHVVSLISQALSRHNKPLKKSRILILGVAFKPDIDDARNSPAERIIELLINRGANVSYHDPYVPQFSIGNNVIHPSSKTLKSSPLTSANLKKSHCVVIITDHKDFDYQFITTHAPLIVDTRNATAAPSSQSKSKIVRLGAPLPPV